MADLILKPGREKALLRRHPWVFSGAVMRLEGAAAPGEAVRVCTADGDFLAWAAYSPRSNIRARVWTWDDRPPDVDFFRRRLQAALDLRRTLGLAEVTNAMRLVHGESDRLPGLVVDRYGDTLVMQCLSAGAERWRETLADLLLELTGAERVFERSDVDVRALEGLPPRVGALRGAPPPARLRIHEHGLAFWVDVQRGHKTGFYLDQRENRRLVATFAAGREVLNAFAYSGGFGLYALRAGASRVVSVDTSAEALALAREHLALNGLPADRAEFVQADVFQLLRQYRDAGRRFDLIVLDPPKFAPTAAHAQRAARGYKDINLLAFKLLRPGGVLATFSCSGGISPDLFQKIVASAAVDAGVEAQILLRLTQAPDHPVSVHFPEGHYLKGLVLRVG